MSSKSIAQAAEPYPIDDEAARNAYWEAKWKRQEEKSLLDRLKRYGLTLDDYNNLLGAQRGVCGGCGDPPGDKRLVIDHDHKTGMVRGLLCSKCNTALGLLRDDRDIISGLADYISWYDCDTWKNKPGRKGVGLSRGSRWRVHLYLNQTGDKDSRLSPDTLNRIIAVCRVKWPEVRLEKPALRKKQIGDFRPGWRVKRNSAGTASGTT